MGGEGLLNDMTRVNHGVGRGWVGVGVANIVTKQHICTATDMYCYRYVLLQICTATDMYTVLA